MVRREMLSRCILLAALTLAPAAGARAAVPAVGTPAPDFSLKTLAGQTVRLSDLRGKVVFLNLWATWCPPCREEMPSMVRFYERFRAQGVEIVAVSEDRDPEAVRKFVKAQGVTFSVALDDEKRVYRLYGATGVPETHLIDRKGVLRAFQMGPFDWTAPEVTKRVQELLSR